MLRKLRLVSCYTILGPRLCLIYRGLTTGRGCMAISKADVGYRAKAMSVVSFFGPDGDLKIRLPQLQGISCETN